MGNTFLQILGMITNMRKYRNISGESGVDSFEIGETYIKVKFKSKPRIYTYSHIRAVGIHCKKHPA